MANKITEEDILNINKAYLELKTYSGVARKLGFSPATVKKYIIPNFVIVKDENIKRFNTNDLRSLDLDMFRIKDWDKLIQISDEEMKEIEDLWKELII